MTGPLIPKNDSQRLAELRATHLLDTERDRSFDDLTRLAAELFAVPIALISLVDRDRQWFKSTFGLPLCQTPRELSLCNHVVYADRPLLVPDATEDPRFAANPLVTGPPHIRFYAGVPVRSGSGSVLGTLCLIDTRPRTLDAHALERLELLAHQAEQLISLHRLNHLLAEQADQNRVASARYQAIIQGAAAGVVRINGRGTMLEVNRFVCDLLGYAEHELLGHNVNLLMPSPVAAQHDGFLRAYQKTGHAKVIGKGREVEARHKTGSLIPIHLAISEV
ncbi:MAG: PAS domain S-box protein [Pseudomonadota bacterium]|nr:PAS domain S-box protein [Pseudomonadota bacterium]